MITELDDQERLDVCVIGTKVIEKLFDTTDVLGQYIRIAGSDYRIVGILEKEDDSLMGSNNGRVFIPLSNAQRMLKQTAITSF